MISWAERAARPPPWAHPPAPDDSGILLTRLFAYRNFADEPFTVSAAPEALDRIAGRAAACAARRGLETVRLADLGTGVLRMLRERHLLPEPSVSLAGKRGFKRLALGADEGGFAWIHEVEHLTWVRSLPGLLPAADFAAAFHPPGEAADGPWAKSRRLGVLASDPSRVGPGVSFRVLAHLPGLFLARRLGQAHAAMSALGLGLLPVARAGRAPGVSGAAEAEPARFWIVFRGGLGGTAEAAYRRFLADLEPVLRWEAELRARCLETRRKRLEERVQGSLEVLRRARTLPLRDLLQAASWARFGASVGILDSQIPAILEELGARTQSGHLEVSSGGAWVKEEEDTARANVVRLAMEGCR